MLYRDTRDSILAGLDHDAWRVMPLEARERALQAEMKADCNLHPALYPPSPDGSTSLGHYKACIPPPAGTVALTWEAEKSLEQQLCARLLAFQVL